MTDSVPRPMASGVPPQWGLRCTLYLWPAVCPLSGACGVPSKWGLWCTPLWCALPA